MTPKKLADYVRYRTKTNSTTFPDATLLLLANIFKDDFAKEIIRVNEDYFGMPFKANLVADQREYPLPTDILSQIKYVEAKLDGTNFIPLDEFDLNQYKRTTDESAITTYFSNEEHNAFFDIFRGSLWIYSGTITSVTDGIKLWSFNFPADITNLADNTNDISVDPTTTSHGLPRQFHELLARRIIIDWKTRGDKSLPLTENENKFEIDFTKALNSLSTMNLDRAVIGTIPSEEGAAPARGDEGYNY